MTEDWELDFETPPRIPPPCVTSCAHCGEVLHLNEALHKQYYNGTITDVEHFCSDDCHHIWHIHRLNQVGM